MKDLTHYFNSPKGENFNPLVVVSSDDASIDEPIENKVPVKRKLNLSNTKIKKAKNKTITPEDAICDMNKAETKTVEAVADKVVNKRSQKRKLPLEDDNSYKKFKDIKTPKSSNKKHKEKSISKKDELCDSNKNGFVHCKTSDKKPDSIIKNDISLKNGSNSSSSDEFTMRLKKSKCSVNKDLFPDSDDEVSSKGKESSPLSNTLAEKSLTSEKSPNSSRNSLFSYFNKVDKETTLKKSSEKIMVEALIHLPPTEKKKVVKSGSDKLPLMKKSKKHKNKTKFEETDSIEIICSEEIVDENSSVDLNLKASVKTEVKDDMVIHNRDVLNKVSSNNLAGIFLPKKLDREESLSEKHVSQKCINKTSLNKETDEVLIKESTKQIKDEKKSVKRKSHTKLNKHKKLKEIDTTEITGENNLVHILNVQGSVKKESKEEQVMQNKNVNEDKLNNLASIFIPKKLDKKDISSKMDAQQKAVNKSLIKENEMLLIEKKEKQTKNKKKPSRDKICLKHNGNLSDEKTILNGNDEYTSSDESTKEAITKTKENCNSNTNQKILKTSNNLNGFIQTSNVKEATCINIKSLKNEEPIAERKENVKNSPKISKKSNNNVSQEKTIHKEKISDVMPNKKPVTINGYFSSEIDSVSSEKRSSQKNSKTSRKSYSSWVMKVRFNRAARCLIDSEDDSTDSIEEQKQSVAESQVELEKEGEVKVKDKGINSPTPTVVVIDDDEEPSESDQDCRSRRKSLQRNAKKQKLTCSESESKAESPKVPVKIWPFFEKGKARQPKEPVVDEAKLKAKMLFLESGVPEIIKKKVENVKSDTLLDSPAPYPVVSHVTQVEDVRYKVDTCSRLPSHRSLSPPPSIPPWTSLLSLGGLEEPEIPVFQRPGNIKAFLQKLQEEEPKTEVKVLYKKLKEYKIKAETDVWTEVYKPTRAADMVGNSESIKKLKTWLETLKNRRKREGSVSSGDEFVNEDSDGDSNTCNNMAVISGPCGCGKTSAIYAVANELDCKVLEINSSCNRSGKRILAEFSESTQSHQVERAQTINGLFNSEGSGKVKKKKKSRLSTEVKSEKTSLILVEDADLLFADFDEGFIQALSTLAATTKRPLILVTNNPRSSHLERFQNTRLLQLSFTRPKASKLGLWLRLVGLVEGVMLTPDQANKLVEWSNCDVRRSLLQLQLMVHSNNSEIKERLTEVQLWWRWPSSYKLRYELPTLLETEEVEENTETNKKLIMNQLRSVADTSNKLAYLDILSARCRLQCGCDDEDPCPVAWRTSCRDSTLLTESQEGHQHNYGTNNTAQELATWLAQTVHSDSERQGQTAQEARWLSILRQGEHFFMPGISTSAHTNHQTVACDYLPHLRDIGRAEQVRLVNYTRRANRFFNYLQGLGIHASKSYRDFMCDAFS